MKRIILSFFLFPLLCASPAWAQASKPLIKLVPLSIEGLGPEEARFIEVLIQSYVTDIGDLAPEYEEPLDEPEAAARNALDRMDEQLYGRSMRPARAPDYILSGSIIVDQDSRILSLIIEKCDTGETVYHTSVHKTTTDLTLRARSLVEAAFFSGFEGTILEGANQERLTEEKIVGTWRGDAGIEIVRLQRRGAGIAILSSGIQMRLAYKIEDNAIKLVQVSPNTERYYHPMPFNVARELRIHAEPWQYELFLYDGGTALRGIKTFTDALYEDDQLAELLPGSIREAEWTKLSR